MLITLPPTTTLYHGTTRKSWNLNRPEKSSIYVTTERCEAELMATEQAESESEDDSEAVVCCTTVYALLAAELIIEADERWSLPPESTWSRSPLKRGAMRVDLFHDDMKALFVVEPAFLL